MAKMQFSLPQYLFDNTISPDKFGLVDDTPNTSGLLNDDDDKLGQLWNSIFIGDCNPFFNQNMPDESMDLDSTSDILFSNVDDPTTTRVVEGEWVELPILIQVDGTNEVYQDIGGVQFDQDGNIILESIGAMNADFETEEMEQMDYQADVEMIEPQPANNQINCEMNQQQQLVVGQEVAGYIDSNQVLHYFVDPQQAIQEIDWSAVKIEIVEEEEQKEEQVDEAMEDKENVPVVPVNEAHWSEEDKPPYNFSHLITLALRSSSFGRLRTKEMYDFIQRMFPYYRNVAQRNWKNSLRHALTHNRNFECNKTIEKRKNNYWRIKPANLSYMMAELVACSVANDLNLRKTCSDYDSLRVILKERCQDDPWFMKA